jgi:hypothetical protein
MRRTEADSCPAVRYVIIPKIVTRRQRNLDTIRIVDYVIVNYLVIISRLREPDSATTIIILLFVTLQ